MSYRVPIAVIVGLVLLLSFGATVAAAETGGQVGVCVVGVDSPCNDPVETTTDQPVGNDTPIQFHPDELPYASGLADGDEPVEHDASCATEADCADVVGPDYVPEPTDERQPPTAGVVTGECVGTAVDHCADGDFSPPGEIELAAADDVETPPPRSLFGQLWAFLVQLF